MTVGRNTWHWIVAAIGGILLGLPAFAGPADELEKATQLYAEQSYQQAQDVLLAIDRDALNEAQQAQRDELVDELRFAIAGSAKAQENLKDAEKANAAGDRKTAEKLFKAVQDSSYASADVKKGAAQGLALIAKQRELESQLAAKPEPVPAVKPATPPVVSPAQPSALPPAVFQATPPSTQPTAAAPRPVTTTVRPAPTVVSTGSTASPVIVSTGLNSVRRERDRVVSEDEIKAGDEALQAGQYDAAYTHYQEALKHAPNDSRAINGLAMVRQYRDVEGRTDLLEESAQVRQGRWARTETLYKEKESDVRHLINENNYEEARTQLEGARQLLEAGKRDADPVDRYTFLAHQADALGRLIDQQEETYSQDQATAQRVDVMAKERERRETVRREKDEKIGQLMEQVAQLTRDRQYTQAANVLRDVLTIDPNNLSVKTMLQMVEDKAVIRDQESNRRVFLDQTQKVFQEIENSRTPETGAKKNQFVAYPNEDEWRIIQAREGYGAGLSSEDTENNRVREQLKTIIPVIDFPEGSGFGEVIDFLKEASKIDIQPNWNALIAVGIDKTFDTGGLSLREKTVQAALELLLKNVGGADINLSYEIVNGIVVVSTRDDLNRNTRTEIYKVGDLLRELPSAPPPSEEDDLLNSSGGGGGFGGGGGGLGGGGGFGGGGGIGGSNRSNRQELELNKKEDEEKLRQDLEEFITQNIAPGTWAPDGTPGSLKVWQDKMIVHHTEAVQRQIAEILQTFRDTTADDQVAIEARFLTLRSNFLEEIGVDLDVILNSANAGYDRAISGAGVPLSDPRTGQQLLMPRQFTQLGFSPEAAAVGGTPLTQGISPLGQPFTNVGLVPQGAPSSYWDRHSTPIPLVNNTLGLAGPRRTSVPGNLTDAYQNTGPAFSLFGGFLDNIQVDFLLRATQLDSRGSSLDAPRLVLVDNEPGEIEIRTYIAYVATPGAAGVGGTGTGGQAAGPVLPGIGYLPRGRKLWVYPQISSDRRYVKMYIQPTVTDVTLQTIPVQSGTTLAAFFQTPEFQITTTRTQAYVPDNGTLLLGGLKLSAEEEVEAGVPVVSKIPVLKRAFTNRSRTRDEYVLLILIKPSIIIRDEQEKQNFPDLATSDMAQKGS